MSTIFKTHLFVSIILHCLFSFVIGDPLLGQLRHYEVLTADSFNHRVVKRSTGHRLHHVEFNALKKHFRLHLWHDNTILAQDFQVYGVDQNGNQRQEEIDVDVFYHGRLEDEPQSEVRASIDEDGVMTASIKSEDEEIYTVEPSWPHLGEGTNKTSMIAYRKSDVNEISDLGAKYCNYVKVEGSADNTSSAQDKNSHSSNKARKRRQAYRHNKCSLLLVADYKFHQTVGDSSVSKTSKYLIALIDRVDSIYTNTEFGDFKDMGFQIKQIMIHETPTDEPGHYNSKKSDWQTQELLEGFSLHRLVQSYCLSHLFTYHAFSTGILGLAYISSPKHYSVGGICSPEYHKDGKRLFLNTGWSSALNKHHRRLLTQEAELVTTHGHNWGSEHDADTSECSPSSSNDGKYIMYTYSVSGYDKNNNKFSPCSRRLIASVLNKKADDCFSEHRGAYCGNSHVEPSEECDPGPSLDDKCCDNRCRLKNGMVCSDFNHVCCESCQVASNTTVCYTTQEGTCEASTNCDGRDMNCPPLKVKPDGTACKAGGKCSKGKCLSFCETQNLESCICDAVSEACLFCCKDMREDGNSTCQPYRLNDSDEPIPLPEGLPCVLGACAADGTCERQIQPLVERIWEIIENLHPSRLVAFMRANIVGTVIIFSLICWIPASCIICYVDRKKRREEEDDNDWQTSESVIHPANAKFIRQASSIHRRRLQLTAQRSLQGGGPGAPPPYYHSPVTPYQSSEPVNIKAKTSYL